MLGDVLGTVSPLDLGCRVRAHLLPTKQTRQGFGVAVAANLSLVIKETWEDGNNLSLGPKFNVMEKSSVPCLGGDPRVPSSQELGTAISPAWGNSLSWELEDPRPTERAETTSSYSPASSVLKSIFIHVSLPLLPW